MEMQLQTGIQWVYKRSDAPGGLGRTFFRITGGL